MKSKRLIRFYFFADILNGALDNLITSYAIKAWERTGVAELYAEKIIRLIEVKRGLQGLWAYLDGVMCTLSEDERETLKRYGALRVGIKRLCREEEMRIKRVAVKFRRRARGTERFAEEIRLLGKYYCLL